MAYPNGKVPASARTVIDDAGRTLLTPSARAWAWVCDEVERRYGWRPQLSAGWTAYRTLAEQVTVLEQNYDHTPRAGLTVRNGGVRYYDGLIWYRRPGKATAAEPGKSNHGLARAVDVRGLGDEVTDTRYRQFADVATEVGFSNAEGLGIRELWHWVHDGVTVPKPKPAPKPTAPPKPKPTTPPAPPVPTEEVTMPVAYVREKGKKDIYAVDLVTGTRRHVLYGEWLGIKAGLTARGITPAKAVADITAAELATIPLRGA